MKRLVALLLLLILMGAACSSASKVASQPTPTQTIQATQSNLESETPTPTPTPEPSGTRIKSQFDETGYVVCQTPSRSLIKKINWGLKPGLHVFQARAVRAREADENGDVMTDGNVMYFVATYIQKADGSFTTTLNFPIYTFLTSSLGSDGTIESDDDPTHAISPKFLEATTNEEMQLETGPSADVQRCLPPLKADIRNLIVYKVTGGRASTITYQNSQGDTSQATGGVALPWQYSFRSDGIPDFLYVSAQNAGGGSITCSIIINGETVKKSTSTGQYSICQASSS